MDNISFEFLNKAEFLNVAYYIFNILADNMTVIAPTGNTRDYDYNCWRGCITESLNNNERQIIIIKDNNIIIGFFQYIFVNETFKMEEIQIKAEYHNIGIFRALYGFVIPRVRDDIIFVEAYASISNSKSIGILEKLGLKNIGLNKNGRSYHFKGQYSDLLKWYNSKKYE